MIEAGEILDGRLLMLYSTFYETELHIRHNIISNKNWFNLVWITFLNYFVENRPRRNWTIHGPPARVTELVNSGNTSMFENVWINTQFHI